MGWEGGATSALRRAPDAISVPASAHCAGSVADQGSGSAESRSRASSCLKRGAGVGEVKQPEGKRGRGEGKFRKGVRSGSTKSWVEVLGEDG
eukprot:851718-Rhodomonas_salina.1